MKLIIAGSRGFRNWDSYALMQRKLWSILSNYLKSDIEIISGGAAGADHLGERFAEDEGYKLTIMPAEWDKLGKKAGIVRNEEMAKIATHCVVFWDGKSPGTSHMIEMCKKYKLEYRVIQYGVQNENNNF